MVFAAYIRETVVRHRQFKMVPELWNVMNVFLLCETDLMALGILEGF